MEKQFITLLDYAVLPFVLMIAYAVAYRFRNKHYPPQHPWRKYFIPALTVKIFGAIFIGMIYSYYYQGGDTFHFFHHARIINSAMDESFTKWVGLLLRIPEWSDPSYYTYISQMEWYQDPSSYTVAAFAAFIGFFTFNTYLPTAVIFACISFTAMWALFRTFASNYPKLIQPIAVAILFIPSTFVWGSGIFKDTICMFGLGWLTYAIFRILIKKDFSIKNLLLVAVSFYLIARVKVYILVGFIPALAIWILFIYSKRIVHLGVRLFVRGLFFVVAIGAFLFLMQRFSKELNRYSLDNIAQTAASTRGWISYVSESQEGASYDLGEFDPSIEGMLVKFPAAVNVTLFRPYIWEANKIIIFFSALEALLFIFITLRVIIAVGLRRFLVTISSEPTIQFCLTFSIIFAFAVGITSYNFGSLSRYKIPCLPFYIVAMVLIYYKSIPVNRPLLKILRL